MQPTQEQQHFIERVKTGNNFVGQARAGCGKTSIVKYMGREMSRRKIMLVVFNKKNADELGMDESKPRNLEGSTFHSQCLKLLRSSKAKFKVDSLKNRTIILSDPDFDIYTKDGVDSEDRQDIRNNYDSMQQCLSLAKNFYVQPNTYDILNLMNKYLITPAMPREEFAQRCMKFLKMSDEQDDIVDFDDMIRFCVLRGLGKNLLTDIFVVDECQDNTPMRTMFMQQAQEFCQVGGIGDDRQAIYAFAGADSDSINNIIKSLENAELLPLTQNFRCGKRIIEAAQAIVPDIQAWDGAISGEVTYTDMNDLNKYMQPGDVGIARLNKVIISRCFNFIKQGKPATIQGKDFGNMLKGMVKAFKATDLESFYEKLDKWLDKQSKYARDQQPSDAIVDRFECLKYLADHSDTLEQVSDRIDTIFSDANDSNTYKFSTGHKAKGLEWDRVHILDCSNFRMKNPETPPDIQKQEDNIFYIAITRAKKFLNFAS